MEITLQPEDNTRLANLCGAIDENIKQIETALEVNINRRGNTFNICGKTNTRMAAQMIENFYARAKKPLEFEDIQLGLVEVDKLKPEDVTPAMPVLMTRRGDLHGRTPRQVVIYSRFKITM